MSKKERLTLPAVVLGRKGQHLDMSPLAKAKPFSRYGKPANGEVLDGLMSLKADGEWMEFELVRHPEGDMTLAARGKNVAALSI